MSEVIDYQKEQEIRAMRQARTDDPFGRAGKGVLTGLIVGTVMGGAYLLVREPYVGYVTMSALLFLPMGLLAGLITALGIRRIGNRPGTAFLWPLVLGLILVIVLPLGSKQFFVWSRSSTWDLQAPFSFWLPATATITAGITVLLVRPTQYYDTQPGKSSTRWLRGYIAIIFLAGFLSLVCVVCPASLLFTP